MSVKTYLYAGLSCVMLHVAPAAGQSLSNTCLNDISARKVECSTSKIDLYVGPQTVRSGETLHIAVETLTGGGASSNAKSITVRNDQSGEEYTLDVMHGLAIKEISAPTRTGRITYTAYQAGIVSAPIEILIGSGEIAPFTLKRRLTSGGMTLRTDDLTDVYGNLIEDGHIATLTIKTYHSSRKTRQLKVVSGQIFARIMCSELGPQDDRVVITFGNHTQALPLNESTCPKRFAS